MTSNPLIGHIMDTKVLKPLTALVKVFTSACKYIFENENDIRIHGYTPDIQMRHFKIVNTTNLHKARTRLSLH